MAADAVQARDGLDSASKGTGPGAGGVGELLTKMRAGFIDSIVRFQ
ncbi:MAG: hypothetical protein WDO13_00565 [Verrucomicrobiota bacterium]